MKTYWQLLVEVTKTVKSRVSRVVPPLLIPREPYPWSVPHKGWWHPTKTPVKVEAANYHITQVVKNPAAFGLTKEKIYEILKVPYDNEMEMIDSVYERLVLGIKDQERSIEEYLFSKGWVRTRGGGNMNEVRVYIYGAEPYTNRAAGIIAIHAYSVENRFGNIRLNVDTFSPPDIYKSKVFTSAESIERYGRGR